MSEQEQKQEQKVQDQVVSPGDSPENLAATMLHLYVPKFETLVGQLSTNALRRVLRKIVQYPFNEKSYKPTSQQEADAGAIAERLIEAKFMLIMSSYHEIVQEDLTKEQESVNVTEETKGEKESNG